jgi:hypothetical protein
LRTFFITEIAGGLTLIAIDPISRLGSGVITLAAFSANGFATTAVRDPGVVTSAATLGTAGNR